MWRKLSKIKGFWWFFSIFSITTSLFLFLVIDHYIIDTIRERKIQAENIRHFGISIPEGYSVHGIDVSHHQQYIHWDRVAGINAVNKKVQFAFIKATEGATHKDRYFNHNWQKTGKHKIIRGAYHFYTPWVNSKAQAQNFISSVKLQNGDLPPVLDVEIRGSYSLKHFQKGIKNTLIELEKAYKMKPIIYTGYRFQQDYLNNPLFDEYPVWIAHYRKKAPRRNTIPWHFWQHSDKGKIKGINGQVDFNVYIGSIEDLRGMCK